MEADKSGMPFFSCLSLLLSTTVLNDMECSTYPIIESWVE